MAKRIALVLLVWTYALHFAGCASESPPILLDHSQQSSKQGGTAVKTANTDLVMHELQTTRWVPVMIGSRSVALAPQQREPFIALQLDRRVVGYGGCNRLSGSFELAADKLKFSQLAATRMACADGMDLEQNLHKALESTAIWRIDGDKLELFDSNGVMTVRFLARNL